MLLDASPGKLESHQVEAENQGRHRRWDSAGFEGDSRKQDLLWTESNDVAPSFIARAETEGAVGKR